MPVREEALAAATRSSTMCTGEAYPAAAEVPKPNAAEEGEGVCWNRARSFVGVAEPHERRCSSTIMLASSSSSTAKVAATCCRVCRAEAEEGDLAGVSDPPDAEPVDELRFMGEEDKLMRRFSGGGRMDRAARPEDAEAEEAKESAVVAVAVVAEELVSAAPSDIDSFRRAELPGLNQPRLTDLEGEAARAVEAVDDAEAGAAAGDFARPPRREGDDDVDGEGEEGEAAAGERPRPRFCGEVTAATAADMARRYMGAAPLTGDCCAASNAALAARRAMA